MSQLLRTATVITRMAIALMIVVLALGAAGATSAPLEEEDCTWGASSITTWIDADATVHQTAPATTGCTPEVQFERVDRSVQTGSPRNRAP
jgi:hypothetical protein